MAIEQGNKVTLDYTGTLDDGTEFDSSKKHGKPITFEVGSGQVIKGFDEAVLGMEKGDTKKFTIQPEHAYGPIRDELKQSVPKDKLPPEAVVGSMLGVQAPNGQQMPAKVIELNDDSAVLDLNHPLAGQALTFEITVQNIE